ncbi:hypothetical protein FSP39_008853 [Pinctada imbricata]|uniref:Uncharacterized protein n=1 Tax=Pinctada imbricata TaxID=66713 RepID=A0AA89BV91_PINIB|nr:hypothetical protein FSP39_008853 [Pinctada imbricata]
MNMLLYAKSVYMIMKDQTLQEYGRLLTEQDIVCTVATQFPEMEIFDFIDLSVFRPDCNAVSSSMFGSLKIKGKHLKSLMTEVDIKAKASPLRSLNPEDILPLSASSPTRFYLALFICPIIGLLITQ